MSMQTVRSPRPLITVERVLAALVLVVVAVGLLASLVTFDALFFYVLYVIVTVFVVRTAAVEPGAWLGLRAVRRGLVIVIGLITLDFVTLGAGNTAFIGWVLFALLVLGDLALGRATRRIATADSAFLDERQEGLRNRSHRVAYMILALSIGLIALIAEVATPDTRRWLGDAVAGGPMIGFLELLFFLPAMVIAWMEPDRIAGPDAPALGGLLRRRIAYGMVALAILLPGLLSVTLAIAPIRTTAFTKPEPSFVAQNGTGGDPCLYFQARNYVGVGFGATIPITAVACWNGIKAYEDWGLNSSDCHPNMTQFALDMTTECRRTTGADGTLHFLYRTELRSPILPFIGRDVVMRLDLTKEGKVLQFP